MKIIESTYVIPSVYRVLQDGPSHDPVELANYFNDLFKLYLYTLSRFEMAAESDAEMENELASMLSELIRVKRLLQEN